MRHIRFAVCALATIIVGTGLLVGAEKAGGKSRQKKAGGHLPPGFSKLDLTDEQVQKIKEIQSKNHGKLADLRKQLAETLKTEQQDIQGVLTDTQKTKLKELRAEAKKNAKAKVKAKKKSKSKDSSPDKKKTEEKKPEEKKPEDNK